LDFQDECIEKSSNYGQSSEPISNILNSTNTSLQPQVFQNPNQNTFTFDEIILDSKFPSGNLMKVQQISQYSYDLWIAPDNMGTKHENKERIWFFFKAKIPKQTPDSSKPQKFKFNIKNMSPKQYKNYENGMVPVYKSPNTNGKWEYL